MSHSATKWALDQRGLKPAAKIVLWQLCDRYHPDNGCFPSQEKLADDCEMSRSALNHHLDVLEQRRLIHREVIRNQQTRRQEKTHYRFPFEAEWLQFVTSPQEPSAESGHGSESGNFAEPSPENDEIRVRIPDSNLVREPVIEPERENAREADEAERETAKLWADLKREYPGAAKDNLADAERLFRARTLPAQRKAVASLPAWMAYLGPNPKRRVMLQDYVRDARWELIPAEVKATAAKAATPETVYLNAYGREWWWLFGRSKPGTFLQKRIDLARQSAIGWPVPADRVAEINVAAESLTHFPKGGEHFRAWCTYWRTLGIDAPIPDKAEWVFLPDHGPPSTEQGQAERVSLSEGAG